MRRDHASRERTPKRWIVVSSIAAGCVVGLCVWYFVSRSVYDPCYYWFPPVIELFCFGLLGWCVPYVFYSKDR